MFLMFVLKHNSRSTTIYLNWLIDWLMDWYIFVNLFWALKNNNYKMQYFLHHFLKLDFSEWLIVETVVDCDRIGLRFTFNQCNLCWSTLL
jgi:hypothetical protein